MSVHKISSDYISIENIESIVASGIRVELGEGAKAKVQHCRDYLDKNISDTPVYGINTGFGSLYNKQISKHDLEKLQENLVRSHSCGMGAKVSDEIVRIMLLLKVQSLSYGNSGVQVSTVERLLDYYNNNVLPVIYEEGSLGASGDLAPLAHMSLLLIGDGEVSVNGTVTRFQDWSGAKDYPSLHLRSKEGLALLNGTQFMSAFGVHCLIQAKRILYLADLIGAISLEAFNGRIDPFNELLHRIRPHKGQLQTAENFRNLLQGSDIITSTKKHVQDPYSFRCIPQVHGASKDAIDYVRNVFETEINSVTDNPTVFPDENLILSGGNFHGQVLALALDHYCLAISELGNISERRTYQLISGLRELPPFLVKEAGLNSGFMIPQYTAASIVNKNKVLCTPASADSIVSSNGQEDHVSMGANAAVKALQVMKNTEKVLAIELFNAVQAIEFRRPLRSSPIIEDFISQYRKEVPFIENDRTMYDLMDKTVTFLNSSVMKHFV